jgi:hypothetical protein
MGAFAVRLGRPDDQWRSPLLDVMVWVQSDFGEARSRGIRRDMTNLGRDENEALQKWYEWEAEEVPFLLDDRPWQRAHFIVGTALTLPHNAETEVVVAPPLDGSGTPVPRASD